MLDFFVSRQFLLYILDASPLSFIYILRKILFSLYDLSVHSPNNVAQRADIFNFNAIEFTNLFFHGLYFGSFTSCRNFCLTQGHKNLFLCFILDDLTFHVLNLSIEYFELIFVI